MLFHEYDRTNGEWYLWQYFISNTLKEATKVVAECSMPEAANELHCDKNTADTSVSVDGTWQKKGFVSSLGVVTALYVLTVVRLYWKHVKVAQVWSRSRNMIKIIMNNGKCCIMQFKLSWFINQYGGWCNINIWTFCPEVRFILYLISWGWGQQ